MSKPEKFKFYIKEVEEGHEFYGLRDRLVKVTNELNQETDRGAALFSASLLDDLLKEILENYLVAGKITKKLFAYPDALSGFSARQNVCLALGLITQDEYDNCNIIRGIRNKFAHNAEYSIDFNTDKIAKLCTTFTTFEDEGAKKRYGNRHDYNRITFILNVSTLLAFWTERAEAVKAIKRTLLTNSADLK